MYVTMTPRIPEGELPVHMNPGSGDPFGVLELGESEIIIHSDEDADRIIRAAAKLKSMRAMIGTPHAYAAPAEYYGHCLLCGMLPKSDDHAEPVPDDQAAAVLARAIEAGTPVIVVEEVEFTSTSLPGHPMGPCQLPEAHGAANTAAVQVSCDTAEHHIPEPPRVVQGQVQCDDCEQPLDGRERSCISAGCPSRPGYRHAPKSVTA